MKRLPKYQRLFIDVVFFSLMGYVIWELPLANILFALFILFLAGIYNYVDGLYTKIDFVVNQIHEGIQELDS